VARVLESAVANAEANHGLTGDELYVSAAYVGAGPTLKRWRARARGRVARIHKRTCHITVRLAMPDHSAIPLVPVAPPPEPIAAPEPEAAEPEAGDEVEEKPKPKRASRKKPAEATETSEKPKRTRAEKADAGEQPKAVEDKPKRATRRKKTEESEDS
jgi:large subunit ribosomal protein L22